MKGKDSPVWAAKRSAVLHRIQTSNPLVLDGSNYRWLNYEGFSRREVDSIISDLVKTGEAEVVHKAGMVYAYPAEAPGAVNG